MQEGDGLALPLPEFRRLAWHRLQTDCNYLIVLLGRHFSGPVFRQTFGAIERRLQRERGYGHILVIRVEDCDIGSVDLSADLADITNAEERRKLLAEVHGRTFRR